MKNPHVTVIMPVYNGASYIRDAIESIFRQTFGDFELLIIDDGSNDSSREIVSAFSDSRIRLVCNEANLGIEETLNRGLRLAHGKLIARMDCDDISLPSRLQRQVEFLDAHPEIVACGTWLKTFGSDSTEWKYPLDHEEVKARMLFLNSFPHAAAMLRKDALVSEGFFYRNDFPGAEDYDLWVRLIGRHQLANIPEVLYLYRQYDQQITRANRDLKIASANRVRKAILEDFGVEMSDAEFQLHCKIALNIPGYSLEAARTWLEKIDWANCQRQYFEQGALRKVLGRFWFSCCLRATRPGFPAWRSYRGSFLGDCEPLRFMEKMKFFTRCAIRR